MKKYKEYKDETPERTINLIRSILTDLDLLLLDSNANCDNIFACRVKDEESNKERLNEVVFFIEGGLMQ